MARILQRSGLFLSLVSATIITGCATNLQRGQDAGIAGDYQAMLSNCQMAAKEKNPNPLAFKCIGDAQLRLGNRAASESAYLTYLDHKPNDTDVRLQLVEMYIADGRYPAAQKHIESVLQFDPASYQAHYFLAEIHRTNALCDSSRQAYERALEINPDYFPAQAGLEKLSEVCPQQEPIAQSPVPAPPPAPVKQEKVLKGGGKALKESEW